MMDSVYRNNAFRPLVVLLALLLLVLAGGKAAHAYSTKENLTEQPQTRALESEPENDPAPNCRYGAATLGNAQVPWVNNLGAGWYLDFGSAAVAASNGAEYVRVITVKQDKTESGEYLPTYTIRPALNNNGLGALIDAAPGALWIVGNEVDRGPDPGEIEVDQGDMFPDVYARAYHDVYHFIKNRDATAQVGNSALVQVTPGRLQYLEQMWDAYVATYGGPMPVDVWNMHLYILSEVNQNGEPNALGNVALGTDPAIAKQEAYDPDGAGPLTMANSCPYEKVYCFAEHDNLAIFAQQIVAMRRWMNDHGERNKPLILSEFSILYPYEDDGASCWVQDEHGNCFTPERVRTFMERTFNYLETATDPALGYAPDNNRLVQQWLWFSVHNSQVGYVSNLITDAPAPTLSHLGQTFRSTVQNQASYINLFPVKVEPVVAVTGSGSTVNVILKTWVSNNGTRTANSFKVTFYKDQSLTQVIGSATVPAKSSAFPGMTGCARRNISVSVPWNSLEPGLHRFWVKVDSDNLIAELPEQNGEADNVASGIVFVNPVHRLHLPTIPR